MKPQHFDHFLFLLVIALMGIGLTMVYSASSIASMTDMDDGSFYFKRQLVWVCLGLLALLGFAHLDYRRLEPLAVPLLVTSIILLVVVLIPGVAREIGGARRWIRLGGVGFQPSEFAKLCFVIYLAQSIATRQDRIQSLLHGVLPDMMVMGLIFVLILKEPNLSTAAIVAATFVVLLFLGNGSLVHLGGLGLAGATLVVALIFQEPYRLRRFLAFWDPWGAARTSGYHIIQSMIAIGSGGWWGLGLGQSRQKFHILPERHTDFIFAIICEEVGLIGGLLVIGLFLLVIYRGFYIANRAPDLFGFLLAAGITSLIAFQALINLGVVLCVLPTTGVTLPFVSYGGSSLLFMAAGVGILLSVSRYGAGHHAFEDSRQKPFSSRFLAFGRRLLARPRP